FSVKEGVKPEKRGFQAMRKKLGEKFGVVFSLTVVVTDTDLFSAIIPLNAPTPQPVAGAPNHTMPGTIPVPQQLAPPEAASVHTLHHCVSTATGLTNHNQPPVQSVRFRRPVKGMATTTE